MSAYRWRAGPDSNRLPPTVLWVCFQKHLSPVLPRMMQRHFAPSVWDYDHFLSPWKIAMVSLVLRFNRTIESSERIDITTQSGSTPFRSAIFRSSSVSIRYFDISDTSRSKHQPGSRGRSGNRSSPARQTKSSQDPDTEKHKSRPPPGESSTPSARADAGCALPWQPLPSPLRRPGASDPAPAVAVWRRLPSAPSPADSCGESW